MYSKEHIEFLKKVNNRKRLIRLTQILILICILALWELAAQFKLIDTFLTSYPSEIYTLFVKMVKSGALFNHVLISTTEVVIGFTLGTILGTLVAIVLWWSDFLSKVLDPYLVVLNALPKTALAPIIIIWVGAGISGIIVTAMIVSIIVTILGVYGGFKEVSNDKIRMLQTFGANKFQVLQKVVIPSSVPAIINALKINVGLSWVGVIVGEFIVSQAGIGYLIVYGSQVFKLDLVMMSVFILAILAALMYQFVVYIEKKLIKNNRWL